MKTGVIYKIELNENNIYIGSTTQKLCKRKSAHNINMLQYPHRRLYKSCIENNITKINCIWVADVIFNSIAELRMIEEKYRKELNCNLNTKKCYSTDEDKKKYMKEYYKNNKEKIKEYHKEIDRKYYEKNKDKLNEKIKCDKCDCMINKSCLKRHQKTNKCKLMSECIFSDSD